ncbi:MAG: DNA adenine methylase [Treponema sp.]|jgi:adenine-specific DNA-methyltransferase|nr:DNA adenine methylase [Treponema sp.]
MSDQTALSGTETQEALYESPEFLAEQLITYIGNKRALLNFIGNGVKIVQNRLAKNKLDMFDVFSGSGIVARYFKQFAGLLIANDLEKYSTVINRCYLSNKNDVDINNLLLYYHEIVNETDKGLKKGIISELYAPEDDQHITHDDRVFYTLRNAMYIDTVREFIEQIPVDSQEYFLAPLLSEASIHANTSGVFKGFYKNRETGIGQFGGKNEDALFRIKGNITLPFPVFSNFETDTLVLNGDSNNMIHTVPEVDLAYLDPPYNQHPYGSNYFMLNLISDYKYPKNTSIVSGIPGNWNRSKYNKENHAYLSLKNLVENIKAKFVLISFNSEGFIGLEAMKEMLYEIGKVEVLETKYNTFRGSRNLNSREIHIKEYLYLLEK